MQICISHKLFTEYFDVLNRKKFARFPDFHARARLLLTDIESRALKFHPEISVHILKDDPDNRLLELAETCNAAYLITGNTNDFTFSVYKGTQIL